jgi:hypothetical protein
LSHWFGSREKKNKEKCEFKYKDWNKWGKLEEKKMKLRSILILYTQCKDTCLVGVLNENELKSQKYIKIDQICLTFWLEETLIFNSILDSWVIGCFFLTLEWLIFELNNIKIDVWTNRIQV